MEIFAPSRTLAIRPRRTPAPLCQSSVQDSEPEDAPPGNPKPESSILVDPIKVGNRIKDN